MWDIKLKATNEQTRKNKHKLIDTHTKVLWSPGIIHLNNFMVQFSQHFYCCEKNSSGSSV